MDVVQYIYIGSDSSPDFSFDIDSIVEGSVILETSVDIIGEELKADQFEAEVFYEDTDGDLLNLGWATPVYYYYGNSLVGKFYSTSVTRTGKTKFKIFATSAVGILGYQTHYGGLWEGETFSDVVNNILATDGISRLEQGYYTKLRRGNVGDTSGVFQALKAYTVYGPYITNPTIRYTFQHKLRAKFTLNRCLLSLDTEKYISETAVRLPLLGVVCDINNPDSVYNNLYYGMYMDVSRNSVNDPWPDYGEVFFAYTNFKQSLGTPTQPTTYIVDVDPAGNTATINGVSYTIPTSTSTLYPALSSYGGGNAYYKRGDGYYTVEAADLYCDALYEYFRVYDTNNELFSDLAAVKNYRTGHIVAVDLCTTTYTSTPLSCFCEVSEDDYVENPDPETYPLMASYPTIKPDAFTLGLLDSIEYRNGIENIPVYGWIDVCTKREALHQLLFSQGVILQKDETGTVFFTYPTNSSVDEIVIDNIYESGTLERFEHTNLIEITEYSFESTSLSSSTTLYDNTNPPSGMYYAVFKSKPAYTATPDGTLNILERNCNAAAVVGSGKIQGYLYRTGASVVSREVGDYTDGKTVTVNVPLVTLRNSVSVADRIEAYYGSAYKVKNSIVLSAEKCGLKYDFTNPFEEPDNGFLTKASKKASSIIKTDCEFVCNYEVPAKGDFSNYVILTGTGTWAIPQEVLEKEHPRIRAILIGGGQGGSSGFAGENGQRITSSMGSSTVAKGGMGGSSGNGGKVYDVIINNPEQTLTYSCGIGGEGGGICTSTQTNNAGNDGTETTIVSGLNTYSSASGSILENGYTNFFTGDVYAKPFQLLFWNSYVGRGGDGGYIQVSSSQYTYWNGGGAADGYSTRSFRGGTIGKNYPTSGNARRTGGLGGGGAVGGTAKNGGDASSSRAGNGGDGANAEEIPIQASEYSLYSNSYYGYGGCGGYGGGGGGSSGTFFDGSAATSAGQGGYGGKGGSGCDGCVLIYY